MLGIIIGIGTVILVLSAGAGFRSLINSQVATLGSNTLFIQTHIPSATKNRNATSDGPSGAIAGVIITSFKQRDLDTILSFLLVSAPPPLVEHLAYNACALARALALFSSSISG